MKRKKQKKSRSKGGAKKILMSKILLELASCYGVNKHKDLKTASII